MPSLYEILDKLAFLAMTPVASGLALSAGLIVLLRDWRISLSALLAQYILTGLLLTRLIPPEIAMLKVLIGGLICAILYLTARRSLQKPTLSPRPPGGYWGAPPAALPGQEVFSAGVAFRLFSLLLIGLAAYSVAQSYPIPEVPGPISLVCYWLMFSGFLLLILTGEPLKAGQGLLTLTTGFDLFYASIERSLSLVGLWGAVNLLLTLAIAYLTSAHGAAPSETGSLPEKERR
jgi:hypothetical protein